jgi:hypothetical protein
MYGELTETFNYVTFGGEDIYDVMDLIGVFDIRNHKLNIISYEENEAVAKKSHTCAVAATLSKVSTISVEIVPTVFPENARPLRALRSSGSSFISSTIQKHFEKARQTHC